MPPPDATPARRTGGQTLDEWLAYLARFPHATLPADVGGLLAAALHDARAERDALAALVAAMQGRDPQHSHLLDR